MSETNGNTPFIHTDRAAGDVIRSADWNEAMTEVMRLNADKVNRKGAEVIQGPLTVEAALNGSSLTLSNTLSADSAIFQQRVSVPQLEATSLTLSNSLNGTAATFSGKLRVTHFEASSATVSSDLSVRRLTVSESLSVVESLAIGSIEKPSGHTRLSIAGDVEAEQVRALAYTCETPVLQFNGVGDHFDLGHTQPLTPSSNTWTVELWFRCDRTSGENILYNKEDLYEAAVTDGYFRYAWQPHWDWSGGNNFPVSLGEWYHAAVVYDGKNQIIYRNGEQVFSRGQTGAIGPANSNKLLLAARGNTTPKNFFQGALRDIRLWKVARSESEIRSTMNITLQGNETGIVGYWPLNEGSGTQAKDRTVNRQNGEIKGASWSYLQAKLTQSGLIFMGGQSAEANAEVKFSQAQKAVIDAQAGLKEIQAVAQQANTLVNQTQKQLLETEQALQQIQGKRTNLDREIQTKKSEIAARETQLQALETNIKSLEMASAFNPAFRGQAAMMRAQTEAYRIEISKLRTIVQSLESQHAEIDQQSKTLDTQVKQNRAAVTTHQRQLQQAKNAEVEADKALQTAQNNPALETLSYSLGVSQANSLVYDTFKYHRWRIGGQEKLALSDNGLNVLGTIQAKSYKTISYEAGGKKSPAASLNSRNVLDDFPNLAKTFDLAEATGVLAFYKISMPGDGSHLVTQLVVDDVVVSSTITGETQYWGNSDLWLGDLAKGTHTIKVKYRTPKGGTVTPSQDWQQNVLRVMVLGA